MNTTVSIEPCHKNVFFLVDEVEDGLRVVSRPRRVDYQVELLLHFLKESVQVRSQDYLRHPACL